MKKPTRILVPVDFSDASLEALDLGASMTIQMNTDLILLNVAEPHELQHDDISIPVESFVKNVQANLYSIFSDKLHTLIASAPWPADKMPLFLVRVGRPAQEILKVAKEENVDLIVMGTHGRRGIARATIGSVTENVIRRSPCPVLALRSGIVSI